jgi:uroporphyrinogen-III synthase
LRKETLPQALKEGGIKFNEIVPNSTTFKISDQEFDAIMFFSPSAVESYLSNNKIKRNLFCIGSTTASALETKIKNIVILKYYCRRRDY